MALGDMLGGNMGGAFSQALTVKVPKSKYGLIEGIAQGQKTAAAKAKRGVEAEKAINKNRADAAKRIDPKLVDPKYMRQAIQLYTELNDRFDNAVINAGSPELALDESGRALSDYIVATSPLLTASREMAGFRKGAQQSDALVVTPIKEYIGNNDLLQYENDGFQSLPGFNIKSSLTLDGYGGMMVNFPKKIDLKKYDQDELEKKDIGYFSQNSEPNPPVVTENIQKTQYSTTKYKLSLDAIKKEVAALYDGSPDYQANVAFNYYEEKRKDPNFKTNIEALEQKGEVRDELINYRAQQIYNAGVFKDDRKQGSAGSTTVVNVAVQTATDVAQQAPYGAPSIASLNFTELRSDGTSAPSAVPSLGYSLNLDKRNISATSSWINQNKNDKVNFTGSYEFGGAGIYLIPVYKNNSKNGSNATVRGKVIDGSSLSTEMANNNVGYEVFVQASSTAKISSGGISSNNTQVFVPVTEFFAQNVTTGTKTQASQNESNNRAMAELAAVRDMLRSGNREAISLYNQSIANPGNLDLTARLIKMADDNGYINNYRRGAAYKAPQEWGQQGTQTPVGGANNNAGAANKNAGAAKKEGKGSRKVTTGRKL